MSRKASPTQRRRASLQAGGRREGWFVRNPFARAPGPLEKRTEAQWRQQEEARRQAVEDAQRRDRSIIKARALRRDVLKADLSFRKAGQRLFDLYHDLWNRTSDGFVGEEGKQDWLNVVTEGEFDLNEVRNDLYLPMFETDNALYMRGSSGELLMTRHPVGRSGSASSRAPSMALPQTPAERMGRARDQRWVAEAPRNNRARAVSQEVYVPAPVVAYGNSRARAVAPEAAPIVYSALPENVPERQRRSSAAKSPREAAISKSALAAFLPPASAIPPPPPIEGLNSSKAKARQSTRVSPQKDKPAQRTTMPASNAMAILREQMPIRRAAMRESSASASGNAW